MWLTGNVGSVAVRLAKAGNESRLDSLTASRTLANDISGLAVGSPGRLGEARHLSSVSHSSRLHQH